MPPKVQAQEEPQQQQQQAQLLDMGLLAQFVAQVDALRNAAGNNVHGVGNLAAPELQRVDAAATKFASDNRAYHQIIYAILQEVLLYAGPHGLNDPNVYEDQVPVPNAAAPGAAPAPAPAKCICLAHSGFVQGLALTMVDSVHLHFAEGLPTFIDRVTSMVTSSRNNPITPVLRRVQAKVIVSAFAVSTQILRKDDEEWFEDGTPLREVIRLTLYPHFNYVSERDPRINPFKLQKALVPWFLTLATSLVAIKIRASFGAFDDAVVCSPEEGFRREMKLFIIEFRRFFPGVCATFTGGSLTGVLAAAGADKVNAHLFGGAKDAAAPEHLLPFDCDSFLAALTAAFLPEERTPLSRNVAAAAPTAAPIAPPQAEAHHSSTRRHRSGDAVAKIRCVSPTAWQLGQEKRHSSSLPQRRQEHVSPRC